MAFATTQCAGSGHAHASTSCASCGNREQGTGSGEERVQGSGFRVQSSEFRVQGSGGGVSSAIPNSEFRIPNSATIRNPQSAIAAGNGEPGTGSLEDAVGNTEAIGMVLMTDYVVTLEVAGVLLLVAMVGAFVLARRPLPVDVTRAPGAEPPGKIGREVPPY